MAPPAISPLLPQDLEEILALEASLSSSWPAETWRRELELAHSWGFVARLPGQTVVAGYLLGWAVADEAEIHKIAVAPQARRSGVATALLRHGLLFLRHQGLNRCFLELRAANHPALGLYAKLGFQETGRRKKYYHDPDEDAITMQLAVSEELIDEKH